MIYVEKFRSRIIGLTVLFLVFAFVLGLLISQVNLDLKDFNMVSGKVVQTKIINNSDLEGKKSKILVIKLSTNSKLFGISDKHLRVFNYFIQNDPTNKEMTIYYNPKGTEIRNNLTLHIGQIEQENEIIMDLNESKHVERIGIKIMSIMLVFILFGFGVLIYKKRKGIIK
jgi:hypothetical protein